MRVHLNRFMATLMSDVDLDEHPATDWPDEIARTIEEGWIVRPTGAVVLARIARTFNQTEDNYVDLTAYEAAVNQIYVPDDGIDLTAADALRLIAARGYCLVRDLAVPAESVVQPGELICVVNVGVWFAGKPGGNTHIHKVHAGEAPWVKLDDLDGYQEEGVLAVAAP